MLVIFHNIPRLAGWSVREVAFSTGVVDSFALTDLAIGHLDDFRSGSATAASTSSSCVRAERCSRSSRPTSPCAGSGSSCRRSACSSSAVRVAHPVGRRPQRHARADDPDRRRGLRRRVGDRHLPLVLDDRRRRVHERVHLRRQLPHAVSDQHLLRLDAAAPRVRDPDGFRLLLPGALHPRQAGPARVAVVPAIRVARRGTPRVVRGRRNLAFAVRHYRSTGS